MEYLYQSQIGTRNVIRLALGLQSQPKSHKGHKGEINEWRRLGVEPCEKQGTKAWQAYGIPGTEQNADFIHTVPFLTLSGGSGLV